MSLSHDQCRQALQAADTDAAKAVMNNADLMAMFVGIMNGTLGALEKNGAALGIIDKWSTIAGAGGKMARNSNVQVASSSVQILTQTLSLMKLGSQASPGIVVATVGAMFTKKVALMFGMVENDKQAAIVSAIADVTSSVLVVGVSATALTGAATMVPAILFVAALGQLGASSWQAYNAMTQP